MSRVKNLQEIPYDGNLKILVDKDEFSSPAAIKLSSIPSGGSGGVVENWIFEALDGTITKKDIVISLQEETFDISKSIVTYEPSEFEYDGTEKCPTVTVMLNGNSLQLGTDYDLTFKNNVNVGNAGTLGGPEFTIQGLGKYYGSKTIGYRIYSANMTWDWKITTNLLDNSKTVKIAVKNPTSGYVVQMKVDGGEFVTRDSVTLNETGNHFVEVQITCANYNMVTSSRNVEVGGAYETDWTKIRDILPMLEVGTELTAPSAYGFDKIVFEVVDIGHVPVNGMEHNITLQTKHCLTTSKTKYPTPHDSQPYLRTFDDGNSQIWRNSSIKSWLNDESLPTSQRGNFLGSFLLDENGNAKTGNDLIQAQAFIDVISKPTLRTYTSSSTYNDENDCKVWLPSVKQMGGGTPTYNWGVENECLSKYTGIEGTGSNTKRAKTTTFSSKCYYWLRSAAANRQTSVWFVYYDGYLGQHDITYDAYGVAPCITLSWNDQASSRIITTSNEYITTSNGDHFVIS